jgi:hypothetical protein
MDDHERIKAIKEFVYDIELNNGNKIPCLKRSDILTVFNFKDADIDYIARHTKSFCKSFSNMTIYNNHFFFDSGNKVESITIVGVSFFCKNLNSLHVNLPQYEEVFADLALDWFYKVDFYEKHSTTVRNSLADRATNDTASEYKITRKMVTDQNGPKENIEDQNHFLYRKIVVTTGTFEKFTSRNKIIKLLYECGADVNSVITKKTHFVIVGKNAGPKKLETIALHNIPVITEEEFYKIFNVK